MKKIKQLVAIVVAILMLATIVTSTALAEEAAAWDGTASTSLKGTGTEDDPYLISSAADFAFMSKMVNTSDKWAQASFDDQMIDTKGMYFQQTCNIDFGSRTIMPVGYIYGVSEARPKGYRAFRGTYDGNGYSLKNATVEGVDGAANSRNWQDGLFGVIWGATIKNVVLDNITVKAYNYAPGALVGYAIGDTNNRNVVENCIVKDTCSLNATGKTTMSLAGFGPFTEYPGMYFVRMGGIVGTGSYITVKNCINNMDLISDGTQALVGGIMGSGSLEVTIENCVNTGDITLRIPEDSELGNRTDAPAAANNRCEIPVGGILAAVASRTGLHTVTTNGNLLVKNCYNTGSFTLTGANGVHVMYGGIVGATNGLPGGYTFSVENCYNLNSTIDCSQSLLYSSGTAESRIAGIAGFGYTHGSVATSSMYLKLENCYSVQLSTSAKASGKNITNEYIHNIQTITATNDKQSIDATNVTTKTEEQIKPYTDFVDENIDIGIINGRSSIRYVGIQKSLATDDYKVRLVGVLNTTDLQKVGYEITMGDRTVSEEGTTVYTSLIGGSKTYYASQFGGTCFVPLVFDAVDGNGAPASGTISVRFYVINNTGVKVYGSEAVTLTFVDGELTVPSADVQ